MANASRRLKRKQETSKKESPKLDEAPTHVLQHEVEGDNGVVTKNYSLTVAQADLFKQLLMASNEAESAFKQAEAVLLDVQRQIQIALVAGNIIGEQIVGGNLDGEEPFFTMKNSNGAIKE
jgi:hypothetical protein